jgi:hypothetical protein
MNCVHTSLCISREGGEAGREEQQGGRRSREGGALWNESPAEKNMQQEISWSRRSPFFINCASAYYSSVNLLMEKATLLNRQQEHE